MSLVLAPHPVDVPGWDAAVSAGLTTGDAFPGRADEHAALRAVAAGDLGLARVLDGHRNALERVLRHRPQDVADADRRIAAAGVVPHGVWGADPRPDEADGGPGPAALDAGGATVSGVKVFCSGAGLVERALVLVRPAPPVAAARRSAGRRDPGHGPTSPLRSADAASASPTSPAACVLLDVSDPARATVDRTWFAGDALRTSASHRVVLDRAPVLAVLEGPPGQSALLEEPWFSGDALRTAATWAGALDAVLAGALAVLRSRSCSDAETAVLGRAHAARATVDHWLDHATAVREHDPRTAPRTVLQARLEITERCREVLRACAELTGSHPIATATRAARAAADLDLLLLQHRLTPAAVRLGRELLEGPS